MNKRSETRNRKRRIFLWAIGLVFLVWVLMYPVMRSSRIAGPYLAGHRGAAGLAPENTLESIETALNYPVGYVEIDVRRTADGMLVLMHDRSINRTTTGTGNVDDLSWQALQDVTVGGPGSAIPTLADALAAVEGSGANLMIEVKDPASYPGIEQQVADAIYEAQMADQVVVTSFDLNWLLELNHLAPDVGLLYIRVWPVRSPGTPEIQQVSAQWLSVLVDPTMVWRMHRQGYPVMAWTVNQPLLARLLWWLGVDGIATDHPEILGPELDRFSD